MLKTKSMSASFKLGASAMALLAVVGTSGAAYADDVETIVVTGYRASLEKAMDVKRNSLGATDSIMAEDIGKFPDMNVSESLQRIPGVTIARESGEGRQLTVRGLGAQFTRVRINGIEAMATVGSQDVSTSGGGTNRGRAFDFNVFASELFNSLTVNKSAAASIEEGSLGATVDLKTARPFDHSGLVFTASAQGQYQEYSGSTSPRVAVLFSNTFLGGRLGFLVSGAYAITNTQEEGTSSVRWMNNTNTSTTDAVTTGYNFNSVCTGAGTSCATSGADFTAAGSAFKPRFPRYDIVPTKSKRLGLTSSLQWQPQDRTLITIDGLFADFAQVRNEYYLEANSFSTSGKVTGTGSYVNGGSTYYYGSTGINYMNLINFDPSNIGGSQGRSQAGNATNSLLYAEAVGVGLRNEHRKDNLDTRFMQVTADVTHEFSDKFKAHLVVGWTESHHRNPFQATLMADLGCFNTTGVSASTTGCGAGTNADPYIYDYSQGAMPMLSTGNIDPTSTNNWFLSNIRLRENYAYNSFRTVQGDVEYDANKNIKIKAGFGVRNYGFATLEKRRSNGVASSTSESSSLSAALRSVPLSSITSQIGFKAIGTPDGADTSWFAIDFDKAAEPLGLYDRTINPVTAGPGYSNSGNVRENDYSGWVETEWNTELYGMVLRGDVGVRYVQTVMNSLGYSLLTNGSVQTLTPVEGHNVYHDWLPSFNAVLEPTDDLLVRFNASYAMSRPGLTSMMPTGSVSVPGSNATASVGNPTLKPTRSKNLDLAFEWYYGKGAMLSIAGFWKHIDTFIQSQQTSGTAANNPFGLDMAAFVSACGGTGVDWSTVTNTYCIANNRASMLWTYSATVNAKGAPLYGTEINWQQPFTFLPAPFDYFGFNANFTYVQAQQTYYGSDGVTVIMKDDLTNLSRVSYNGTLYYDDQVFQARITGAFRSHYLINSNIASNNNNYGIYSKSTFNLDASMSYKYSDEIMLTLDALNLTNQGSNIYADKFAQRSYQFHKTGRVLFAGIKYTY